MKNLARFSLRNRSLITLLAVVGMVFGGLALTSMRQDLVPTLASSSISIVTSYDSATPVVVDSEVSQVIETVVESVDGLVSTTTYSANGLSLVTAEFELGLDSTEVMEDISKKLAENSGLLPDDVKPQVSGASVDDFPVMQFAVSTGDAPLTKTLQDSISQRLEGVKGVREARFAGIPSDRMDVELNAEKGKETGIGVRELQEAIVSGGAVDASGSLTEGERTLDVQSGKALVSVDDIKALPVVSPKTGKTTTIGEVADVQHKIPGASLISRVDGEPTIVLLVSKIPNANTVEMSENVQAEMSEVDAEFDLDSSLIFDQSPYIKKSIETLATEGLIGLVCAIIVVFFFLTSVRTTLVTAVSIPGSLLLAGIAMYAVGFTVNMITLAALTVAVGRVVDDSIVVVESIEREMLVTTDRVDAIVGGVSTVAGAVMSSTLTTVAVFLPIAFIGGTIGELFRPFALTAAAALIASLLVSLTIVPVLAYWFVRPRPLRGTVDRTVDRFDERVRTRLDGVYRPLITRSLSHPWRIVAFSAAVLIGTGALIPGLSTGYLAPIGDTQIRVLQKLDPGTSLDAQKAKAEIIEKSLQGIDGVERVQTSIRSSGSIIQDASLGGGDGIASYVLSTPEAVDQTAMIDQVRSTLEDLPEYDSLGELDYSITSDMEFSSGIEIGVTALDEASLTEAIDAVTTKVEGLDSVADTQSSLANTVERLDVHVDGAKAVAYGLTDKEVRDAVHDAISSTDAGTMVVDGDTIDIVVLPGKTISSTADLSSIPIATPVKREQPLSTFATVEHVTGPIVLQSQRGLRYASIMVEPRTDNLGATSDELAAAVDDIDLPDGANVTLGGSVTARVDAFEQMGIVSLIALLIVYTIMVATFRSLIQPILLLIAVPFAATGGAIIQRITGEPIGVPSLIGCLMLVGIVVTNSIVLVDLVNQRRAAGTPLREAIIEGASRRVRPILMTAAATVFALLPMAIGLTSSSAFISRPLALVVIGGMVSSTVLTLVVLPVLYFLLEGWRERRAEPRSDGEDEGPRYRRSENATVPDARPHGTSPRRPRVHAARRPVRREPARQPARASESSSSRQGVRDTAPDRQRTAGSSAGRPAQRPRRVVATGVERQAGGAGARKLSGDLDIERESPRLVDDIERTTRLIPSVSLHGREDVLPSAAPLTDPVPLITRALRRDRKQSDAPTAQYVTFAQDEERTAAATVSTWWTNSSGRRRPLLMLDPFMPHTSHGVGIAEPVNALEFSGTPLSPEQFRMVRSLSAILNEELHGYAYFAAQLVLWEILSPTVGSRVDVRVPASDADIVSREFETLYARMLHARVDSDSAPWIITPTVASEPRMIMGSLS